MMFGTLSLLISAPNTQVAPEDIPPPTPVNFPQCHPRDRADGHEGSGRPPEHLSSVLQGIIRPTEVTISHLEALGTHMIPDSTPAELIPDPVFIPDFDAWHALSADDAHAANEGTRRKISNGGLSPGCQTYLERRRELSIPNEAAYRAVRRIPVKGQPQARLGNSYEFYRHLELFAGYWDDTSKPSSPSSAKPDEAKDDNPGAADASGPKPGENSPQEMKFMRVSAGHQMPPEFRQNIVTAFLKLVAYDFGCNVSAPRTEPRLYITSNSSSPPPRSSYFSSGCTFIFRTPTARDAARAGVVEGPLVAVSVRHTTTFAPLLPARPAPALPEGVPSATTAATPSAGAADRDSTIDLARELIAALITAQHRAREGREEKRIGEGAWWATKPRWGGGPGGPIGREVEMQAGTDVAIGDKDAPPPVEALSPSQQSQLPPDPPRRSRPSTILMSAASIRGGGSSGSSSAPKGAKRLKKSGNLPMYENYRMVRPPAAAWDKKTKYSAIGKVTGADYDDVFIVSALFHHVSILRVRVPDRLLAVLEGEVDEPASGARGKSWGKLEVRRSKWFDLFLAEERIQAMQLVWSLMAFLMRAEVEEEKREGEAVAGVNTSGEQDGEGDIKMAGV